MKNLARKCRAPPKPNLISNGESNGDGFIVRGGIIE